jgi:hypothetical protein
MHAEFWSGSINGKSARKIIVLGGRIILKWFLSKMEESGLDILTQESDRLRANPSGPHKRIGIS